MHKEIFRHLRRLFAIFSALAGFQKKRTFSSADWVVYIRLVCTSLNRNPTFNRTVPEVPPSAHNFPLKKRLGQRTECDWCYV